MKDMGDRENKKKVISLPYGDNTLEVVVPDRIIFYGAMEYIRPADNFEELLLDEIPLGLVENPCRWGMEKVAKRVGLRFIINTIMNFKNEVIDIVAGDFVKAHRKGAKIAEKAFGVSVPEPADIVIVSSHSADIDYWQAEKGVIPAKAGIQSLKRLFTIPLIITNSAIFVFRSIHVAFNFNFLCAYPNAATLRFSRNCHISIAVGRKHHKRRTL